MSDDQVRDPQVDKEAATAEAMKADELSKLRMPAAAGIPNDYLNTVKVKSANDPLTIVTVSSGIAWPEASAMRFSVGIQYGGKLTTFNIRGVSDSELSYIQGKNEVPEAKDDNEERDPGFIELRDRRVDLRKVSLFELAIGEKIPGNTEGEKLKWLRGQCTISIQNLYDVIQDVSLGLGSNDNEGHYRMHLLESPDAREFLSFAALEEDPTYSFIRGRQGQDYVNVFAMNAITEEVKLSIENSNKLDPPPMRPSKSPDGTLDYKNAEPWFDEPMYKLRTDKAKKAKSAAYMSHCIPFNIPDDDWIGKRMAGDVLRMKLFIQQELLDPSIRTSFF